MTDREKLIELLIGADDYCNDTCNEGCNVCKYNGDVDCAYNVHADHFIANGVTVQKWIPVTKRLPTAKDADKYGRVLVMELGMMSLVNYRGPINYPDKFPYWMPLPEPPKGE